jgi:NAD(P)-dependent dehydrogenase (short-subunit alcohol dehydrogenase family)
MLKLKKRTIVITGATSGIGLAAAELMVKEGAFVIGVGRSPEKCAELENRINARNPPERVSYVKADLSIQSEVRSAARKIHKIINAAELRGLDGLLNNAGTFTYWLTLTAEGFEKQWAVNHLAPFLLTFELLPLLLQSPTPRVVTVSSNSHYNTQLHWDDIQLLRSYYGLKAYKQTKLANVLFTTEFNRRLGAKVRAFAADPGLVDTDIGTKSDSRLSRWFWSLRRRAGIPAIEAAKGIMYLFTQADLQDTQVIYWKHGEHKPPSRYALDTTHAQRLWSLSEKMCGIDYRKFTQD